MVKFTDEFHPLKIKDVEVKAEHKNNRKKKKRKK